jgi:hypothetical protein
MVYYVVKFYDKNGDLACKTFPWQTIVQEAVDDLMHREGFEKYEIIEMTEEEADTLINLSIRESKKKRGGRNREVTENKRLH